MNGHHRSNSDKTLYAHGLSAYSALRASLARRVGYAARTAATIDHVMARFCEFA